MRLDAVCDRVNCMPTWLFNRFIVRRLLRNPMRLLLLAAAIALSTVLVVAVVSVSRAGVQSFQQALGYSNEEYPLVVTPRGGRLLLKDFGRCLASLQSKFEMLAVRRELGVLATAHRELAVTVIGVSGVTEGPLADSGGEGINFSLQAIREMDLKPGGAVELVVDSQRIKGHVTAATSTLSMVSSSAAIVPLTLLPTKSSASRNEGPVIDALLLRPHVNEGVDTLRAALTGWLHSCSASSVPLEVDTARTRMERGESLVAAYRLNVSIMAAMTLLVCALLVSQATQLSLRNLSRELSILRTLGVGRAACLLGLIQESLCIAVIGAIAAVTVGEPLTIWITEHFLQTAHEIYDLSLGAGLARGIRERVLVVCGIVVLCAISAAGGGWDAMRVAPSLGTRIAYGQARALDRTLARHIAVIACAVALIVGVFAYSSSTALFAYLFVVACIGVVIGATPYVVAVAPSILRHCGKTLNGSFVTWFARGGVATNGRNFLLGASAASVSVALICALTLMVSSFRQTLDRWTARRLQGDLFISSPLAGQGNEARISPDLISEVAKVPGVQRVVPYYETMTTYQGRAVLMSATDIDTQLDRGVFVVRRGTLDRAALSSGRSAMVSESAASKVGLSVGSVYEVDGQQLTTSAIVQDFSSEHPLIQVDQRVFSEMYPRQPPENLTIDIQAGVSLSDVRQRVEQLVGQRGVVRDNRELRNLVLGLFDRTFAITLSIRWIVFGIALLALMLAALQHLWERRREIKTMYVLGFAPAEIVAAHIVESALVCSLPVCVGLMGGIGLGWGLTALVNPRSFGWTLDFTFSFAPLGIAASFIVGVAVVVGCAVHLFLGRTIREATLSDE